MGLIKIEIPEKDFTKEWKFTSYNDIEKILNKIRAMLFIKENYDEVKNSIIVDYIGKDNIQLQEERG